MTPATRYVLRCLAWAVAMAVVGGVSVGFFFERDRRAAQDLPREQVEVIAVEVVPGIACKGYSDRLAVTYRSTNAPAGMPTTFTDRSRCDALATEVGERLTVVRLPVDDGPRGDDIRVLQEPARSTADVAAAAGLAAGLLALIGLFVVPLQSLGAVVRRHIERRAR